MADRPWDHDVDSVCPQCRAVHDGMANIESVAGPEDGDVNLCIVCRGISVYDSTVPTKLRFPTDEELDVFMRDPRIHQARAAMGIVDKIFGPPKGDYYPD